MNNQKMAWKGQRGQNITIKNTSESETLFHLKFLTKRVFSLVEQLIPTIIRSCFPCYVQYIYLVSATSLDQILSCW